MIEYIKFSDWEYANRMHSELSHSLNDKVIILRKMPSFCFDSKMNAVQITKAMREIQNYEVIIITDAEQIYLNGWFDFLKLINDSGKFIILETFTVGIKHYLNKKIPNNNILLMNIDDLLSTHIERHFESAIELFNTQNKRQFLLKHFSYNRNPHRDYITDFLLKRNLVNNNNITFHNFPKNTPNLKEKNIAYCYSEAENLLKDVDLESLNNLQIIPESENFYIENQNLQSQKLIKANSNTYFEIISEAQMPLSDDPDNFFHYTYSITKRTLFPLLFGNVFHYMPNSIILQDDLKNFGIEMFFKNDNDFLNNLNEEFYFDKNTQYKLLHNFELIKSVYENRKNEMFTIRKLKEIFK